MRSLKIKESNFNVMEWMLDIQLGRRNLSPIQRIAVAEKYRPMYEKEAKENQSEYYGNQYDKKSGLTANLPQVQSKKERNHTTDKKLADIADVSEKTYRMGAKILNSDNEEVKEKVLSGDMSINAGYNKIRENTKQKENKNNESTITQPSITQKESSQPKISEETKQICVMYILITMMMRFCKIYLKQIFVKEELEIRIKEKWGCVLKS